MFTYKIRLELLELDTDVNRYITSKKWLKTLTTIPGRTISTSRFSYVVTPDDATLFNIGICLRWVKVLAEHEENITSIQVVKD